ncbi:MAG: RluA family pseudouridine synthase [Lachnospiraceae bacterium]|nr:RluA family pseudouridine synthase [Lachnospiraceae bacterium]
MMNNLEIIYEDSNILIIYKPAGVPVQTASITSKDCISEIKNYLSKKGVKNPYVAVINRLDQPVSGLVLFALDQKAAAKLSDDLQNGRIDKYYHAKVYGEFEEKEGTLTDVLYKDAKQNISMVVKEGDAHFKDGKKAILNYREVSPGELDIKLITGRHHQIRVQLASAGHPILGDLKYGTDESKEETKNKGIDRLQLTSYKLVFRHPTTKKELIIGE